MISIYTQNLLISLLFVCVFALNAFIFHQRNSHGKEESLLFLVNANITSLEMLDPSEDAILFASITILWMTLYTLVYFTLNTTYHNFYGQHLSYRNISKEATKTSVTNNPSINPLHIIPLQFWYCLYVFAFSVFGACYSLVFTNTNVSFIFCIGTFLTACIQYTQKHEIFYGEGEEPRCPTNYMKSKSIGILVCLITMNSVCFCTWIYETNISMSWKDVWIEGLIPFFSPFFIYYFKKRDYFSLIIFGNECSDDSVYLFLVLPLLSFLSFFYLALQYDAADPPPIVFMEVLSQISTHTTVVRFILAPFIFSASLVLFMGSIGRQSEYVLVCSSSLSLIFFFSQFCKIEGGSVPCCVMSVLAWALSLLSLIVDVYHQEEYASKALLAY